MSHGPMAQFFISRFLSSGVAFRFVPPAVNNRLSLMDHLAY